MANKLRDLTINEEWCWNSFFDKAEYRMYLSFLEFGPQVISLNSRVLYKREFLRQPTVYILRNYMIHGVFPSCMCTVVCLKQWSLFLWGVELWIVDQEFQCILRRGFVVYKNNKCFNVSYICSFSTTSATHILLLCLPSRPHRRRFCAPH